MNSGGPDKRMTRQRPTAPFSEDALQRTLTRVLRPLVRLALSCGLTFPAFSAVIRRLFIDVAEKEFAIEGKSQTDSRISLITGIHRKDVSRLRTGEVPMPVLPPPVSRTSRIVARWLADPRYCDEHGLPRPLPRTGTDDEISFETLVGDVTRDLRARAVLDEWLDRGIAVVDADDRVHLSAAAIVPEAGDDALRHYFTRNLHDHAAAAVANMVADAPPFLERAVHYNRISPALAARLEALSREEAMQMLLRLNRVANDAIEADEGGDARWTTGVYVFRADHEPENHSVPAEKGKAE